MKYLTEYRTFETTQQLNDAIRKQVYANNFSLTASARAVFDVIAKHSVKFGAAHLTAQYIADKIGKSVKTARRAITLLTSLAMIEKIETTRKKNGGDGANIFRILPAAEVSDQAQMTTREQPDKPTDAPPEQPKSETEANNSLSYKKSLINNTYSDKPAAPSSFYGRFKNFVSTTVGQDQSLVSRLFAVYKAQTTALVKFGAYDKADVEHVSYEALRASVMATKSKKIRNIVGYYNGTLDKMLDALVYESAAAELEADE